MTKQEKFINLIKDGAIQGWKDYKILPSLTIAQAILETGWGGSSVGNNLFGIKANKDWKGKTIFKKTHEYVNGKKIYIDAYFRDYDNIYESLKDRFEFLQKPRYKKVIGVEDYKIACNEIWKAGYATDPEYPNKLIRIIEQYNLSQYDKQAMKPKEQPIYRVKINGKQIGAFKEIKNILGAVESNLDKKLIEIEKI